MQLIARGKTGYEPIEGSPTTKPCRKVLLTVVSICFAAALITAIVVNSRGQPAKSPSEAPADLPVDSFAEATCPLSASSGFQPITIGSRMYQVYVPSGITFPSAAVLLWHGISSTPDKIEQKVGLKMQADEKKFLAIYPEAQNKGQLLAAWNGAGCCNQNFADVQFALDIIRDLTVTKGCVTASRVFSMGFSNGGFMTNRLACEQPTKVKAICVHSGLIGDYGGDASKSPWGTCDPVPMVGIHGTADTTVSINGGKQPAGSAQWLSFNDTMAVWERAAACTDFQTSSVTEGGRTVTLRTGTCQKTVKAFTIQGHGHDWWSTATEKCMSHFGHYGL